MTKFFGLSEMTVNSGIRTDVFTINLMRVLVYIDPFFSCFLLKLRITFHISDLSKTFLNCFCEWVGLDFSVFYMVEPIGKKNSAYKTKIRGFEFGMLGKYL